MNKIKVARINELARMAKADGLSPEEAAEQKALRQEFIAEIKADLRSQLDSIEVVDDDTIDDDVEEIEEKIDEDIEEVEEEEDEK